MWQKPKIIPQKTVSIGTKAVFTSPKKAFYIIDSCCQCMVSKNSHLQSLTSSLFSRTKSHTKSRLYKSGFSLSGVLLLPTHMLHLHKDLQANLRIFAISSKNTSCVKFTPLMLPPQTTMFYGTTR